MPKVIKFSGTALSKTRGKGNMRIGANSHDYGTSYYSMIEPPAGGYTVYENKASGGPSIRVANNEAELINLTRESSGTTYVSAAECLAWFATQTDKLVVSSNDTFDDHVTDGLVLELNAANLASYPTTGTTWYDLSGNGYNGTLVNGSTFDSNSILFDGVNDYVIFSGGGTNNTHAWTADNSVGSNILCYEIWFKGTDSTGRIISKPWNGNGQYNISVYPNAFTLLVGTQSNTISFPTINNGNWHQLIVWANSTQMGYYLDGASSQNSITHNLTQGVPSAGNNNLPLGLMTLYFYGSGWAGNTGHAQNGNVASFKKYNRVITTSEAKQNYYGGDIVTDGLVLAVDAGNLVSYESGSTTTYDMIKGDEGDGYGSYDLNGTLYNGVLFNQMNGGTWDFDGTNDYIGFGTQAFQYQYDDNFSLEVWCNPDALSGFKHLIGVTYASYRLAHSNSGISFRLDANNLTTLGGTLVVGEWSHIIATWDPLTFTAKVYQNGVQVSSVTNATVDWTSQGTDFRIASSPGENYYFNGKIPIGRVYNKTLSASEVLQNFNAQRNRFGI